MYSNSEEQQQMNETRMLPPSENLGSEQPHCGEEQHKVNIWQRSTVRFAERKRRRRTICHEGTKWVLRHEWGYPRALLGREKTIETRTTPSY